MNISITCFLHIFMYFTYVYMAFFIFLLFFACFCTCLFCFMVFYVFLYMFRYVYVFVYIFLFVFCIFLYILRHLSSGPSLSRLTCSSISSLQALMTISFAAGRLSTRHLRRPAASGWLTVLQEA